MNYETQKFGDLDNLIKNEAKDILVDVCGSLREKKYNPVNQIVGYILSGDPTYITSYNNARKRISKIERDDLLEEMVRFYLRENDI